MASPSDQLPKVLILGGETRITFIAAERLSVLLGLVWLVCVKMCDRRYASSQCINLSASLENKASAFFHVLHFASVELFLHFFCLLLVLRCRVCGTPFDNILDK